MPDWCIAKKRSQKGPCTQPHLKDIIKEGRPQSQGLLHKQDVAGGAKARRVPAFLSFFGKKNSGHGRQAGAGLEKKAPAALEQTQPPAPKNGDQKRRKGCCCVALAVLLILLVIAAVVGVHSFTNGLSGIRQPGLPAACRHSLPGFFAKKTTQSLTIEDTERFVWFRDRHAHWRGRLGGMTNRRSFCWQAAKKHFRRGSSGPFWYGPASFGWDRASYRVVHSPLRLPTYN